jgi:hypothetical protein
MLELNLDDSVGCYNFKVFLISIYRLIFFIIAGFFIILFFGFNAVTITLGILTIFFQISQTSEELNNKRMSLFR